jgi:toxin ParE1/3/4
MTEIFYSPLARLDLKDVYRRIVEFNPASAADVVRLIDHKARLLTEFPSMGQAIEELATLRRFPVGDYLIFYREALQGIEIVRVLHGARDFESLFRDT